MSRFGFTDTYSQINPQDWEDLAGSSVSMAPLELTHIQSLNDVLTPIDVNFVYRPLARLIGIYAHHRRQLNIGTSVFRRSDPGDQSPLVIAIAGSVAAGKSTTARMLQRLLEDARTLGPVTLVATDAFLYPNRTLNERGILDRKGFPESYDREALLKFLADLKANRTDLKVPVYSHLKYDIEPNRYLTVNRPGAIILEGLNVLQAPTGLRNGEPIRFVSDYIDFSIFMDAKNEFLEAWFVERFLSLKESAFRDPDSYFYRFSSLDTEEVTRQARIAWRTINRVNLIENILPARGRATVILSKGRCHSIEKIFLRKT